MADSYLPPAVICAENIALLHLLHTVPVLPFSNAINASLVRTGGYSLSFTQERNLASILSFLSNMFDNPNHVPALCIAEGADSSLNVMLAVNKARQEDGNVILQALKQRLDEIFAILSEVAETRDENRSTERRIFTTIISMCSKRILARLRFRDKKRGGVKQPLRAVLGEAVNALKQMNQQVSPTTPVKLFIERAKDIISLADSWNKHQTLLELENLVEGIYRLKQIDGFPALLDSIPNRAMSPTSRQNLANIVSKVSRYRESARFLYRMSKKTPILRRARIVVVDLPKEAFYHIPDNHTPRLASTLRRISAKHQNPTLDYLKNLLSPGDADLNNEFADQARKSLSKAKIHAEVQLVLWYELNPSHSPPRVVCSSKDACFLCNRLILVHGKMHTPRCHGRLYPGWRLPLMLNLSDLQSTLNTSLEDEIKKSLQNLLARKDKTRYPNPNESTLLTLQVSTSTLRTTSALVEAIPSHQAPVIEFRADIAVSPQADMDSAENQVTGVTLDDKGDLSSVFDSKPSSAGHGDNLPITLGKSRTTKLSTSQSNSSAINEETQASDTHNLIQGIPRKSRVASTRDPRFYTTGSLEVHLEYAEKAEASVADQENSAAAYSIEWLLDDAAKELIRDQAVTVVDVEAMQSQTSCEADYNNGVIVMARGNFVRISSRK